MFNRKRFIFIVSILMLALVVQACGSTPATEAPAAAPTEAPAAEPTEAPAEEPTEAPAEEPAASEESVEFRVLIAFTDKRLDYTREQAAKFMELYPQYNVVVEGLGSYNEVFEAAMLSVEQGNAPGVIQFYEAATQEARDAVTADGEPLIKSVTDALGGKTEINGVKVVLDDIVDAPRNYYSLDGKMQSVPWNTSSTIMFSNMSIFEAAGVEKVPETWAEVDAACEAIMALDDAPDGCIAWPNHSWLVEQTLAQQGELFVNEDNGRSARATEVFMAGDGVTSYVQWWKDIYDKGYYLYTGKQRDWGGTTDLFNAQQVAMLLTSSSLATSVTDTGKEAGYEVEASFMPYSQDVPRHGNIIGGATLYLINNLSPEAETGALMFMNYFQNPESAAGWHKLTGYIPITQPAVDLLESEGWFEENPNYMVATNQLADSEPTPASLGPLVGNFMAIRDVFTAAVEKILVEDADVAETMKTANEEANALLADYNLLYGE